jgi:hypothetical protein
LYEATENELQGSGVAISKITTRVLKVTDFEKSSSYNINVEVENEDRYKLYCKA